MADEFLSNCYSTDVRIGTYLTIERVKEVTKMIIKRLMRVYQFN